MNQRLLDEIRDCPNLPSLPAVALRVLDLTQSNDVSAPEVARVISMDPALSGKVLRTVNSAFYGVSQSISSINSAVVILGLQSVKTLVLGFSLVGGLSKDRSAKKTGFDHVSYWRRSLYAATAAKILSARAGVAQAETCFVTALLMDIGMLVLDRVLGERYAKVVAMTRSHGELVDIETAQLDLSHDQVSGFLAERWHLPETLALAMGHHHSPEGVEDVVARQVADVVSIAARCADIFVDKQPMWSIAEVRRMCMDRFNIGEIACDAMLVEIGQRTREMAPLFEIRVAADADYDVILQKANTELLDVTKVTDQQAAAAADASDRRRAPRIKRNKQVTILPCADGTIGSSLTVQLQDVSARGVGFTHTTAMRTGEQFIFRVPRKDTVPITLLYTVVRCVPRPDGTFTIGAELDCVLKDQPIDGTSDVRAA